MSNDFYFDGDSVDLTDDQREFIKQYYKGDFTAELFIKICRELIGTATDRKNKVSIAQALAATYNSENAMPGEGDQHLKSGMVLADIQDLVDTLSNSNEPSLDDDAFSRHWESFKKLVHSQSDTI